MFGPKIIWTQIFLDKAFFTSNCFGSSIYRTNNYLLAILFFYPEYLWTKISVGQKIFWPKILYPFYFLDQQYLWTHIFLDQKFFLTKNLFEHFWTQIFLTQDVLNQNFCWPTIGFSEGWNSNSGKFQTGWKSAILQYEVQLSV